MSETARPTVSVILPTFNRAHLIEETLAWMRRLTYPILELIVVDDGSSDNTKEVLERHRDDVHFISQENGGKLSAINTGLKQATGDLIWVMDDDDLGPDNALELLVEPFIADPELGLSYGRLQKFKVAPDGTHEDVHTYPYPPEDGRPFFVRIMEDCYITGQPCWLVRKACYDAISPLPEEITISEDYAVLLALGHRFTACRVDEVTLWQRQHDGARGPAATRYAASERNKRWSLADTEQMSVLLPSLALWELVYSEDPERELTKAEQRLAYLQKAVIAGRRKLWDMAIEAIEAAVAVDANSPLTDREELVLQGMLGARYGIEELWSPSNILDDVMAAFAKFGDRKKAIRAISSLLPYGARLRVAEGDWRGARRRLGALWKLNGAFGGGRVLLSRLTKTA